MGWEKAVYIREMFVGLVRKGTKIPEYIFRANRE